MSQNINGFHQQAAKIQGIEHLSLLQKLNFFTYLFSFCNWCEKKPVFNKYNAKLLKQEKRRFKILKLDKSVEGKVVNRA